MTLHNLETESDGYKVDYLWKEILTPTLLLINMKNLSLFTHETEFFLRSNKYED